MDAVGADEEADCVLAAFSRLPVFEEYGAILEIHFHASFVVLHPDRGVLLHLGDKRAIEVVTVDGPFAESLPLSIRLIQEIILLMDDASGFARGVSLHLIPQVHFLQGADAAYTEGLVDGFVRDDGEILETVARFVDIDLELAPRKVYGEKRPAHTRADDRHFLVGDLDHTFMNAFSKAMENLRTYTSNSSRVR